MYFLRVHGSSHNATDSIVCSSSVSGSRVRSVDVSPVVFAAAAAFAAFVMIFAGRVYASRWSAIVFGDGGAVDGSESLK